MNQDILKIGGASLTVFNNYCSPSCVLESISVNNVKEFDAIKKMLSRTCSLSIDKYVLLDTLSKFKIINGVMQHDLLSCTLKLIDYEDLPSIVSVRCVYTEAGDCYHVDISKTSLSAFVTTILLMDKPYIKLYVQK